VSLSFTTLSRKGNPHLERNAILLPAKGAAFHLKAERLVRESKSPDRRAFRLPQEMAAWLDEVLDDGERAGFGRSSRELRNC
jgi:hypothetical protein